jgi:tetratricopeptide (TPR) repeat protein
MKALARLAGLVALSSALAACGNFSAPQSAAPPLRSALPRTTDAVIAQAQQKLRETPDDWRTVDLLAGAYLQKVREIGDPTYYPKAQALLDRVLAQDASDLEATTLMGTLSLARHQFADALQWGLKARALDAYSSRALGVIGDAQVELGRYPDAVRSFQAMVDLRPDLSSYARVSYARELYGDVEGAIAAMSQAVEAGGPVAENSAYTRVLLGNLYFNAGRLSTAEAQYRQAEEEDPGYPYALAGLARIQAARKEYQYAIALYQRAVDAYPLPDFVIALGDVQTRAGDTRKASETYALASAEQQLYRSNGVDLDAELALFDADHQRDLPAALAAARRAMADRPNVRTADILAWTLYQAGDYRSAMSASAQARRLGTQDAMLYFHAGMIESKLKLRGAAINDLRQALRINPNFSVIWAPVASTTLADLGGSA